MTFTLRRALAVSILLHALFALYWRHNTSPPDLSKLAVQVEFRERPQGSGGNKNSDAITTHRSGAKAKPSKRSSGGGIALKNLAPGGLKTALNGGMPGAGTNLTDEGDLGLNEEDWGSHGGKLDEITNYNQYEKLFTHLQGMVNYPGLLGTHGLSDSVNSRLVFDANSHCNWSKSRVGGTVPAFRVYTLALLKKLCAMETMEHIRFRQGQFVDVSFSFVLVDLPDPPGKSSDFIQGNVLSFRRIFIKPRYEVHAGPLQWSPLSPNMVFLDFPWIFEHWDKWVEGHDPMDEFREH